MSLSSTPPPKKSLGSNARSSHLRTASEELSQISAVIERRRIQNRTSQRTYRTKLKSRIEQLEKLLSTKQAKDEQPITTLPTPNSDTCDLTRTSSDVDRPAMSSFSTFSASSCENNDNVSPTGLESTNCSGMEGLDMAFDHDAAMLSPNLYGLSGATPSDVYHGDRDYSNIDCLMSTPPYDRPSATPASKTQRVLSPALPPLQVSEHINNQFAASEGFQLYQAVGGGGQATDSAERRTVRDKVQPYEGGPGPITMHPVPLLPAAQGYSVVLAPLVFVPLGQTPAPRKDSTASELR